MIACFALCWLGTGLVLGAKAGRVQRRLARGASLRVSWLLRGLGLMALVGSTWALRSELQGALVLIAALLALAAVASLASVLRPLVPRLYALSVPVSALVAALTLLRR